MTSSDFEVRFLAPSKPNHWTGNQASGLIFPISDVMGLEALILLTLEFQVDKCGNNHVMHTRDANSGRYALVFYLDWSNNIDDIFLH